ncbi:MAG: TonB-dependent receptor [Myxococcales bacterium]|nr:TonB-dependent receptor [Myxococcales bacterium]
MPKLAPAPLAILLSVAWTGHADAQYSSTARVTRQVFDSVRSEGVVDEQQADRAAVSNVGDAMQESGGVVVQRTSSASAAPIVRGLTGNRVLLTLDQLRLSDSLTRAGGNALLNLVDPESVERVEVVRGPASVVHGSDALGGVVRVVTKRAGARPDSEDSAWGTAYLRGASAERAYRAQAGLGVLGGPFGARVSGGRGHAGELERGGDLGRQPFTGHDDWSFASRLEASPSRAHRFALSHQSGHIFDAPRSDVSTLEDLRITESLDRDSAVLEYSGRFPEQGLRVLAHGGIVLRREHRRRIREDETRDERDRVLAYQLGLGTVLNPWGLASLELGAEAVLEGVGSTRVTTDAQTGARELSRGRYVDDSRYHTYAGFGLLSQPLGETLTLLAGARATLVDVRAPADPLFDPDSEIDRVLDRRLFGAVGSLGLRQNLTDELSMLTSLLMGFRAPNLEDFQAFGGGARGFTIPNPELDEERSWTLESGLKLQRDDWQVEGYLWGTLLTGLIVRVPATFGGMDEVEGDAVLRRDNASRSTLLGAELSVVRRFESGLFGGFSGWATWGETERPGEDGADIAEPASKIPPPTGALELGYEPSGGDYWLKALVSGQLPQTRLSDSDLRDVRICEDGPDDCDRVDGHVDLTLRAGAQLGEHLSLILALENVLDRGYKTFASGAYAPGRNFVAALRGEI